jgi:hypothetical protein
MALTRIVCVLFALSSYPLAAWLLVAPDAFWSLLGVGGNPFAQAIYAGAIAAEGVMFTLGARQPARYAVFFEYMLVYKTLAVLAGARVWLGLPEAPMGGLAILGGWAVAGVVSGAVVFHTRRVPAASLHR